MRSRIAWLAAAGLLLAAGLAAQAGVISVPLDNSGWMVTGVEGTFTIILEPGRQGTDAEGKRFVAIEIFKYFREPLDPQTGIPSINLIFMQTAPDEATANRIYIADEAIANYTGVPWYDFHWFLAPNDVAHFNRELTNPADPNGWNIDPFTSFAWSPQQGQGTGSDELSVRDGTPVLNGFFPGFGSGNLVIDVVGLERAEPAIFILKEVPTIPEPVTMILLVLGGLAYLRRHR